MKVYSERKRNGENKMAPDATRTKQPLKGLIFNIQKFSLMMVLVSEQWSSLRDVL